MLAKLAEAEDDSDRVSMKVSERADSEKRASLGHSSQRRSFDLL